MRFANFGKGDRLSRRRLKTWLHLGCLAVVAGGFLTAFIWDNLAVGQTDGKTALDAAAAAAPVAPVEHKGVQLFQPLLNSEKYPIGEQVALIAVLLVAVAGLVYARMLVKQVKEADQGTPKMQEIARAVREGANAYLGAQFKKIGPLIIIITVALFFTKYGRRRKTCPSPSAAPARSCSARCLAGRSVSWACVWPPPATCGWPPPPSGATAKPCSSATAPARSPAC